jgi:hypothetical protein
MTQWLRDRTVVQYAALGVAILTVGAIIVSHLFAGASVSGLAALALVMCGVAFRKELLWRVRNRLLVTYLLFGVIPIVLIGLALMLAAEVLLGFFAAQLVRQDLKAQIESVRDTAQTLVLAASHTTSQDLWDGIRQRRPRLAAVVLVNGSDVRLPRYGPFSATPPWIAPGFGDLFESDGRYYVGADARVGNTEAFVYAPLDNQALASITPRMVSVPAVLRSDARTTFDFGPSGNKISVVERGVRREIVPAGLGPPRSGGMCRLWACCGGRCKRPVGRQRSCCP